MKVSRRIYLSLAVSCICFNPFMIHASAQTMATASEAYEKKSLASFFFRLRPPR